MAASSPRMVGRPARIAAGQVGPTLAKQLGRGVADFEVGGKGNWDAFVAASKDER